MPPHETVCKENIDDFFRTGTDTGTVRDGRSVAAGRGGSRDRHGIRSHRHQSDPGPAIHVASHKSGVGLFELGSPASAQLKTMAEEGNVAPLTASLLANPEVLDVVNSGELLDPGKSVTQRVRTHGRFDNVSVAAMLSPTNDGFFALNDAEGPNGHHAITHFSPAYDSGTERNDETCASIPGPNFVECGGPGGGGAPGGGEGFVHIHAGIHGIGDIEPAIRDWRNPVARITIRRVTR